MHLNPGNTATGTTSLHILMIRTGSSLGTNKVFFGHGSHDEDGQMMMIVGFVGIFS